MRYVTDRKFYSNFLRMTGVLALQNIVIFSVNLADNVMLTMWSSTALAGVALVNQIQFLLQMLMQGAGEGALVFSSRYWGEGRIEPIRKIANIGMKCALIVSLLLGCIVYIYPEQILGLLSPDPAIIAAGTEYAKIIVLTYPVFAITQILLILLRSVESVRIGFAVSVVTLFVNVGLNYVLIFGKFGLPQMGIAGAALATLTARLLELTVIILYTRLIDKKINLRFKYFLKRVEKALLKDYIRIGIPVFASAGMWGIAQAIQTAILGHMDGEVITANTVAITLFQVLSVFIYASASSTAVIMGKTIGEKKTKLIRPYSRTFQLMFLCIGLMTGLLFYILRYPIIALYGNLTEEAKILSVQFILILSVTSVGTAYQMPVLSGIVRSGGDTSFVLKNDTVFMWGIVLPCSSIAAFVLKLSPVWVFFCLKSDQILKCFVAVIKVNRYKWLKKINRNESIPNG